MVLVELAAVPVDVVAEDRALLRRLAEGDADALGRLYDRHAAAAMGLARRILGDAGLAEEVVQDAFVSAWRRADSYDAGRGAARSWLLGIVHNRAIDRLRSSRGMPPVAELMESEPGSSDVWSEVAERLDRRRIVDALRSLPAVQREAIELSFFGGMTHLEVAERLDQPLGTVKGRIRLGLAKLRGMLPDA